MLAAYVKVVIADLVVLMLVIYPLAFGMHLLARRRILAPAEYRTKYWDVTEDQEQ